MASFLSGERDIINGNLQLCLACPDNVVTRLLLAQTVVAMKKVRPAVVAEFQERISLLEEHHPLGDAAGTVVQRILAGTS